MSFNETLHTEFEILHLYIKSLGKSRKTPWAAEVIFITTLERKKKMVYTYSRQNKRKNDNSISL